MDDQLAESALAGLWECMETMPAAVREDLGIAVTRVGTGVVVSTARSTRFKTLTPTSGLLRSSRIRWRNGLLWR
jgi:hypothetical protein